MTLLDDESILYALLLAHGQAYRKDEALPCCVCAGKVLCRKQV